MRPLLLLMLCAPPPPADQYLAVVGPDPGVLRSGPSDQYPDTGTAPAGTTVIVHHEENGWLAVQPPRGSLAWVPIAAVPDIDPAKPFPQNGTVDNDGRGAAILAGRTGHGLPLGTARTTVPDGTVVTVVGPKVKPEPSAPALYPIVPPEDDFRFLPATAVRSAGRAAPRHLVRSPAGPDDPKPPTASVAPRPAPPAAGAGTWADAEAAEKAGETARAEALYKRLAGAQARPGGDPDLANRCFAKVHALREKSRLTGRAAAPADDWVGPGGLRPSAVTQNGRPTFALVAGPRNDVKCYVQAGPGLDLGPHVGGRVELFGRTTYPGDLRGTPLLTATRVRAAR